jgi:hypothetical protein
LRDVLAHRRLPLRRRHHQAGQILPGGDHARQGGRFGGDGSGGGISETLAGWQPGLL